MVRFRMPEGSTTFTDLVRGEVTFDHAHVPDFVLARADGSPLYTLAVAVDDVLMKITHVVRGEDLLSSTPRQIAVYRAMGVAEADFPVFAHLPYVLGKDGQRLSKRNGVVSVNWYREEGFLPEAIDNYLALLGWSPGDDREEFSLAELAAEFDLARVNKNPAQFDVRKLEAINGDKIRALDPADFVARITPFLERAEMVGGPAQRGPGGADRGGRAADPDPDQPAHRGGGHARLPVRRRCGGSRWSRRTPEKVLTPDALPVLQAAEAALAEVQPWTHEAIEAALKEALIERLGLKPRFAFAPVRVAVTGKRVSPPLYQSIELLGRERTLTRLAAAIKSIG